MCRRVCGTCAVMWTKPTLIGLLVLALLMLLLAVRHGKGATATWGQVNKYASTLYTQDVYLNSTDAAADADADTDAVAALHMQDVAYGSEASADDDYTITAVHAYDLTRPSGDGGRVKLLSGGVGQRHARVRLERHEQLPSAHFQLVIYGLQL